MNSDLFDEFKTQMYHSYMLVHCVLYAVYICIYNKLDNSLNFIRFTKHNRLVSVTCIFDYFVFMLTHQKNFFAVEIQTTFYIQFGILLVGSQRFLAVIVQNFKLSKTYDHFKQ